MRHFIAILKDLGYSKRIHSGEHSEKPPSPTSSGRRVWVAR
jgi:hypothetical protein